MILVFLVATSLGCEKAKAKKPTVHKKKPATSASATPSGSAAPHASSERNSHAPTASSNHESHEDSGPRKFALPFAWELGENEPLARTKNFFKEVILDNREYMRHGQKFFEAFAKAQKPRATVLTCADSRVQTAAWDNTPENDDFTIRNIGNLVATSRGSIEYGIEHLNTPVFLIVGHTGCGAVKAAMSRPEGLSKPIADEISSIVLPNDLIGDTSDTAWASAVVANVHAQVRQGLDAFAPLVHEGRLTIVGAVYDFRNDLGKGTGKFTIIDVNGNSEPERVEAFANVISGTDVTATDKPNKKGAAPSERVTETSGNIESIQKQIEIMKNK
jgi:carbonic anhydrase